MIRIATDIGGTFTDIVLDHHGVLSTLKVLTTPEAPERAVVEGVARILAAAAIAPGAVGLFLHGTTLATNAVIERRGARTALVATAGFEDTVEIGREHRYDQYNLYLERPAPLVPPTLRFGMAERVDVDGGVATPLAEAEIERIVARVEEAGVQSVAVCLLHSYANPAHERRLGAALASRLPGVSVSLSCDISPVIGEFERCSTTCANAYVQPAVAAYLGRMAKALAAAGIAAPILVMLSEGALASVAVAARFPVRLIESGPAGGAMLAGAVARRIGRERLLSFDMGGTTAKICLIEDGRPRFETMFEADRIYRFRKGSGLPLRIPVVDLVEIGAGGGSIARTDAAGRLHVGPESAGSVPGPAAYGRGSIRPTVTDADLLLGRIVPERFAGGAIGLDRDLAARAAAGAVGAPLGLPAPADAAAIAELVEENMAGAARTHGAEKGRDLAAYTLLAFGGAAGLHAAPMAARLGIAEIIVPPNAGVGSAVGFLVAPAAFSIRRTVFAPLAALDQAATDSLWREMAAEARAIVASAGAAQAPAAASAGGVESWAVDLRYAGQGTDITIPLDRAAWRASGEPLAAHLARLFEAEYVRRFARERTNVAIEITAWSLTLELPQPEAERLLDAPAAGSGHAAPSLRPLYDLASDRVEQAMMRERASLPAGETIMGPALIVEDHTSVLVPRGWSAHADAAGFLVLRRAGGATEARP